MSPDDPQIPAVEETAQTPELNFSASTLSEETAMLYSLVGDAHLLTPVVLIGASALIPLPFLDDVAKGYLERRLFRTLAEREQMSLTSAEVDRLTQEPPSGCFALGCLGKAVIYPIKRMIRKILYFLEIKRAVDQSTTALAEAWLFQLALRRGLWSPGRAIEEVDVLRQAMETACQSHGVKPLEAAFQHAFSGAKGTLRDFASRFTGKSEDDKRILDEAVQTLESDEGDRLASLTQRLNEALGEVSEGYLQRFAQQFEEQLALALRRQDTSSPIKTA